MRIWDLSTEQNAQILDCRADDTPAGASVAVNGLLVLPNDFLVSQVF